MSKIVFEKEYIFDVKEKTFDASINYVNAQKNIKELKELLNKEITKYSKINNKTSVEDIIKASNDSLSLNLDLIEFTIKKQFNKQDANYILENADTRQLTIIKDLILASWQGITYEELQNQKTKK